MKEVLQPEKLKGHWVGSVVCPGVVSSSILITVICTRLAST